MYRDWQFLWSDMPSFAKRFFTIFVGRGVLLQIFLTMTFFIGKASRFIFWFIFSGGVDIVPKIWQRAKKKSELCLELFLLWLFLLQKWVRLFFLFRKIHFAWKGAGDSFPRKTEIINAKISGDLPNSSHGLYAAGYLIRTKSQLKMP